MSELGVAVSFLNLFRVSYYATRGKKSEKLEDDCGAEYAKTCMGRKIHPVLLDIMSIRFELKNNIS